MGSAASTPSLGTLSAGELASHASTLGPSWSEAIPAGMDGAALARALKESEARDAEIAELREQVDDLRSELMLSKFAICAGASLAPGAPAPEEPAEPEESEDSEAPEGRELLSRVPLEPATVSPPSRARADAALGALAAGASATALAADGFDAAAFRALGVAAEGLRDAGFSAEQCRDGGYGASSRWGSGMKLWGSGMKLRPSCPLRYGAAALHALCAEFPRNAPGEAAHDPSYNELSILGADGAPVVTARGGFGTLVVASWSPDMYSAPPAWTRDEDGWDIRNRKHARPLRWRADAGAPPVKVIA